jgi:hypothetical protein
VRDIRAGDVFSNKDNYFQIEVCGIRNDMIYYKNRKNPDIIYYSSVIEFKHTIKILGVSLVNAEDEEII